MPKSIFELVDNIANSVDTNIGWPAFNALVVAQVENADASEYGYAVLPKFRRHVYLAAEARWDEMVRVAAFEEEYWRRG